MIKLIYTGKKKPDRTIEEFKAYYLEQHAPLFMKTVPQARKYTINFPTVRPGKEPPLDFDFITEIWWDDVEAVRAFYRSDAYKNIIEPDEQKLFASGGSAIYFDEFVQKA